ncbi:MAG: sugar ABC transporter permease [Clostridia bacterium]|nr:sugar ABC transporter permease [Clostridia bacterium]
MRRSSKRVNESVDIVRLTYFQRLWRNMRHYPSLYLLFIPVLLYFLIFKYGPMFGAVIAFEKYRPARGILHSQWVGLKNFREFLTGPYAKRTIINTLMLNFWQILIGFPAPILLAILLNEVQHTRYKKVVQTTSYLPYFISLVVVCGIIKDFTASDGLFSDILASFGFPRENLLTDPRYYRAIYVASSLWQACGWGSILYIATLTNTDPQLYEAATIDGAGRFRCIWHVTLPALLPVIIVQLIMRIGNIMSYGADRTLLLYSPAVYDKADIISSFVYRYGLQDLNFSFASAVDLFNSVINLILLYTANKVSGKLTGESLW